MHSACISRYSILDTKREGLPRSTGSMLFVSNSWMAVWHRKQPMKRYPIHKRSMSRSWPVTSNVQGFGYRTIPFSDAAEVGVRLILFLQSPIQTFAKHLLYIRVSCHSVSSLQNRLLGSSSTHAAHVERNDCKRRKACTRKAVWRATRGLSRVFLQRDNLKCAPKRKRCSRSKSW